MELAEKHPDIECLGTYNGAFNKIPFKHLTCGYCWSAIPNNIINHGYSCPQCYGNPKKSHECFIKEVFNINPNIICLETYLGSKKKLAFKHLICGHTWYASPDIIINKKCKCPQCYGNPLRTQKEFINELSKKRPDVECLGEYAGSYRKIQFKHLTCGHIWYGTPASVIHDQSNCPNCSKSNKKSQDRFISELKEKNPNIIPLEKYKGCTTKISFKHCICGHEWVASPHHILFGSGCPVCNEYRGEAAIRNFLQIKKIQFIPQHIFKDCKNIKCLSFDFYIPDLNLCIEYQGAQHYEATTFFGGEKAFKQRQHNDKIKREFCKKNNVLLLEIKYTEDVEYVLTEYLSNTKYSLIIQS